MNYTAIITSCRRPVQLKFALDSVCAQTLPPYEIIIIDDSGDVGTHRSIRNLLEENYINKKHSKMKLLWTDESLSQGISKARNTGIRAAQTAWLAFLDDDDEWESSKAALQVAGVRDSELRLCHTDEIWLKDRTRINPRLHHRKSGGYIYLRCLELCCISPSSCFIHSSLFKNYGLFDTKLPACEDYDMWLRICAYEPVLYINQRLTIKHGGHKDQLSRRYWGMDRFRINTLIKMMKQPNLEASYRAATKDTLLKKLAILYQGAKKRGKQQDARFYARQLFSWQ